MSTTWNPSDNSDATLSNGNLTASFQTTASTWHSIRSTTSKSSGKYYFEVTISQRDGVGGWICGIGDGSASLTNYTGSSADSAGAQAITGLELYPSAVFCGISVSTGDVLGFAIDVGNKLFWANNATIASGWSDNAGGSTGDPSAGSGGLSMSGATTPFYIMGSGFFSGGAADTLILNPGPSGFVGSAPSGFSSWDPAVALAMTDTLGIQIIPRRWRGYR